MTGPRIEPQQSGVDAHGMPIIPRTLSYEEWQQARGMSTKALGAAPFPAQPPVFKPDAAGRMGALKDGPAASPRDVTRTPADPTVRGKTQTEYARTSKGVAGVLDNLAAPIIDHPWMTAGAVGASMIPVIGPYVGAAMMGDMASSVALYGYQRHLEQQASPDARKLMEADPERISGEAATAQAIMLGLGPVLHLTGKAVRGSAGKALAKHRADAALEIPLTRPPAQLPAAEPRPAPAQGDVSDMTIPVGTNKFIADLEAGVANARIPSDVQRPAGFEGSKAAAPPARNPKHPSGFSTDNPFAPENVKVKPIETTSPADQLQSVAAAKNDPMRPRRRPKSTLDTPEGAELLGSVAARNGLDVESNPFPPGTPRNTAWKNGHAESGLEAEHVSAPLEPLPAYPDGFAMGGMEGRMPDVPPLEGLKGNRPLGKVGAAPPGATAETAQAALDLKPSKFRTHTTDELAEAALDAQAAIEAAQQRITESATRDHVAWNDAERSPEEIFYEDRGAHATDIPSQASEKALSRAKAKMAQIEREFTLRGISSTDLADVMAAAKETRIERQGMQEEAAMGHTFEPTPTPAPVAEPAAVVAAPAQAGGALTPIEGTGATQTRGASRATEARAVAANLTSTLGDLPRFQRADFAEHAANAVEMLDRDPALARRIALGEEPAPAGMIPEMFEEAVKTRALAEGDVGTLRDLATSKLTEDATTMAQRLAARGYRDPESPVTAMQELIALREKAVKNPSKAIAREVADGETHLGKMSITRDAWTTFVDALRCS